MKVNIIARLEYELVYYDSAVHRFKHYTTRTFPAKKSVQKWLLVCERLKECDGCDKVSYLKSVSFCSVILATCDRALSWSKINSKLELIKN